MEKPLFELYKSYPVTLMNDKTKKGLAYWLGFGRGTEYGFFEAVFDVTLESGEKLRGVGQLELYFYED